MCQRTRGSRSRLPSFFVATMPLLRSSSTGGPPKEVKLDVRIPRPPGQEEAVLVPRKGASSGVGALRSAGKHRVARQASKSPYARPKNAASSSQSQPQPVPPPQSITAGLTATMDSMQLGGPVSARTRLRQKMFLKRPAQTALANSLVAPPQGSSHPRAGPSGAGTSLRATTAARSQSNKPQPRLVPPSDASANAAAALVGGAVLPPREALAEARRRKSSSTAATSRKGAAPTKPTTTTAAYAVNYPASSLASTRASMRLADGRAADEGARTVRIQAA